MKKKLFIIMLMISSLAFAEKLKINTDANVRSIPSKDGEIISVLKEGTKIEGKKSESDINWYEVNADGKTGYVHKSLTDEVVSISDVKGSIVPFKSGLFWWIVIDKIILLGVFLYFFLTGKARKAILWAIVCLISTVIIAFILSLISEELFMTTFGYTALLCVGASPFILLLLILIIILCWATSTKKEPKLRAITYWIEDD